MVDTTTPGASTAPSGAEDDDFDIVNAEEVDGVEDTTADEEDDAIPDVDEDDDVNSLCCSSKISGGEYCSPRGAACFAGLYETGATCIQDYSENERQEIARKERDRLRKQDQAKRQRLDDIRQQQNSSAANSEVFHQQLLFAP